MDFPDALRAVLQGQRVTKLERDDMRYYAVLSGLPIIVGHPMPHGVFPKRFFLQLVFGLGHLPVLAAERVRLSYGSLGLRQCITVTIAEGRLLVFLI